MMLRSCSTPVLGSLLSSSITDSPNDHYETSFSHFPSISFHPSPTASLHLSTAVSCGSSPISPSVVDNLFSDFDNRKGFHRAQSEGNLDGLLHAATACDHENEEYFYNHNQYSKKVPTKYNKGLMLQTIPSFSFYNSRARCEEEDEEEEEEERVIMAVNGSHELNTISSVDNMLLTEEEVKVADRVWDVGLETFIDRELGGDSGNRGGFSGGSGGGGDGGWGGEFNASGGGDGGGDNHEVEEYYKRMVEENPGNPLYLSNYARFLYQRKKDVKGAEEYYCRAILADPKDGETLSQYGKLVWEVYLDQERASSYFERAIQVSPHISQVHAAYASFLWETEEDADECATPLQFH